MARPQAAYDLDFVRELSVHAAEAEVYVDENYDADDADLVIQSTGTETNPPLNFKVHRKVLAAASTELANLIQAHLEKLEQEENAAHAEPVMKAVGEEKAVKPKAVKAKAVKPVEAEKAETAEKTEKGIEAEKAEKAKNTDREDTAEKSENAENAEKADQISQRKIAKLPGSRVGQAKTGKASSPVYIESESDDSDKSDLEYDESSDDDDTSDEDDSSDSDDSSNESSVSANKPVSGTSYPVEKREKKQQKLGKLYNHETLNKENDHRIVGDVGNHAGAHAPKIFPLIVLPHSDDVIRIMLAAAYNRLEGMQLQLDDEWEFIQEVWETAAKYQMFVLRCYAQMTLMCVRFRRSPQGQVQC